MTFTTDEQMLRAALHDATLVQPEAPVDRVGAVRRRHTRRRALQSAAAAVAVIAVVAAAAATTSTFRHRSAEPADRGLPAWALAWPDNRDKAIPQTVLDGAVAAWQHVGGDAPLPPPKKVIWYLGQTVAGGSRIAVVFEVDGASGHRLVAGQADADAVLHGEPGYDAANASSPWALYDVPAPDPSRSDLVVGLNTVNSTAAPGSAGFLDNQIVVLTTPRARSVSWTVHVAGGHTLSGLLPLEAGYGTVDTGQDVSRVRITGLATGPEGQTVPVSVFAGVPGSWKSSVPELAQVPALAGVVTDDQTMGEMAGQGSGESVSDTPRRGGRTTVYARCYGGASITVVVDDKRGVKVPCDDVQHAVPGPTIAPAHKHSYFVHAGDLVAWRVIVRVG